MPPMKKVVPPESPYVVSAPCQPRPNLLPRLERPRPMKIVEPLTATFLLLCAGVAHAHYFEFCDLEGDVTSVDAHPKDAYVLVVDVTRASRAKEQGQISRTDCREYEGKPLEVTFAVSEIPGRPPAIRDHISFSRSVITINNDDGSHTHIRSRLPVLRKATSSRSGR